MFDLILSLGITLAVGAFAGWQVYLASIERR